MPVILGFIICALGFSVVLANTNEKRIKKTLVGCYSYIKYTPIMVFLALFFLWFFSGYRSNIGDTWVYIGNFNSTPKEFVLPEFSSEFLFYFLQQFMKSFVTDNPNVWFFLLNSISTLFMCLTLSRYSVDLTTSIFYYIFCGSFIYFFNGVRQLIAIMVCFYATKYLEEQKIIKYILMILFAFLFHESSIIMFLGILFYKIKPWSKMAGIICVAVAMIGLLPNSVLTSIIGDVVEGTSYEHYASQLNYDGVNIFRFLTVIVPSIFTYMYRDRIEKIDDPILNYCVNMSLVASLIYFIALFMTALVAVRIAEYFLTFNVLLYPYLFKIVLPENMRSYKFIFYIGYGVFFYYQMYVTWGGLHYTSAPLGIYC